MLHRDDGRGALALLVALSTTCFEVIRALPSNVFGPVLMPPWLTPVRERLPCVLLQFAEPLFTRLQALIHSLLIRIMPSSSLSRFSKSGMWAAP